MAGARRSAASGQCAELSDGSNAPCGERLHEGKSAAIQPPVGPGPIGLERLKQARGCSSDGRALQSHCRGQEFDPPQLHQPAFGISLIQFRIGTPYAKIVNWSDKPQERIDFSKLLG